MANKYLSPKWYNWQPDHQGLNPCLLCLEPGMLPIWAGTPRTTATYNNTNHVLNSSVGTGEQPVDIRISGFDNSDETVEHDCRETDQLSEIRIEVTKVDHRHQIQQTAELFVGQSGQLSTAEKNNQALNQNWQERDHDSVGEWVQHPTVNIKRR